MRWVARLALLLAFCAPATVCAVATEYRVDSGDVLEISVWSFPELRQRVPVQPDGAISVPVIGNLLVEGLTREQIRQKIEDLVARRFLARSGADGREKFFVLKPGDVSVNIVEQRPVYIGGDVLNPGQYTFRTGLTLRQLVTLAGGVSALRGRSTQDPMEIRTLHATEAMEVIRLQVHLARIEAELSGADDFKFDAGSGEHTAEILRSERQGLKNNNRSAEREREFLRQAIRQADAQIEALILQEKQELAGLEADVSELDRINKQYSMGNLPSPRVTEGRRAVLLSSTRRQQTAVNLIQTRRQRDEFEWRIQKNDFDRKAALLSDDRETRARLGVSRARLEGLGGRMGAGGGLPRLGANDLSVAEARLVRRAGGSWLTASSVIDEELQAGDVVVIRFTGVPVAAMGVAAPSQ